MRYIEAMTDRERVELMEFLAGQFGHMHQRFGGVDRQIASLYQHVEARFTGVDRRFDVVDGRSGEMLGHLDEIYRWLERLEQAYHVISEQLRRIEASVTDESGRRERLERDLTALRERIVVLQVRIAEIERRLSP